MILSDNETTVDLLNNEAIAATVIKLLRHRPDRPITIGVHGDWGAGKSSVLEMIAAGLNGQGKVLCLKFNGWRFQGFEDAKIALIEGIVNGLLEERPALTKATNAVKEILRRIDWLKVAKKAGGLAFTAFTGIPTPDQIQSIIGGFEGLLADPLKLATKDNIESAVNGARSLLKPAAEAKNVPEEVREFRKAFDNLLKEAGIDQLVVLIDDLDRCLPDTAIETLEAIRLFVFTPRTAFVVAADETMIEYAVRKHFPDLPDTTGPRDYARNYLEKLIQVPLRIPALGETETRIYVTLLLVGRELGEDDTDFQKLIAAARTRLQRPWENRLIDATVVKEALGSKTAVGEHALVLSEQIGPILAGGTEGNPRQIKRFLNALLLRQSMAEARGFGDEVELPVLAKLMLAERFIPTLFDQVALVAVAQPDGTCPDLAALEALVRQEESEPPKAAGGRERPRKPEEREDDASIKTGNSVVSQWATSEKICEWARVDPPLGGVDLRPYLFVAKDRKDYFGATSTLGHLASVVERLLGPKLSVQGMQSELGGLAQAEASQVFDAVCARIMASGRFVTEPQGVAGLAALVAARPELQGRMVDFLEHLPVKNLGAWIVKGWSTCLTSPDQKARFDRLVAAWGRETTNRTLSAAAGAVARANKIPL